MLHLPAFPSADCAGLGCLGGLGPRSLHEMPRMQPLVYYALDDNRTPNYDSPRLPSCGASAIATSNDSSSACSRPVLSLDPVPSDHTRDQLSLRPAAPAARLQIALVVSNCVFCLFSRDSSCGFPLNRTSSLALPTRLGLSFDRRTPWL